MAVTRIKSNQITDGAVITQSINDYAVTGSKLANALTYGSDLTVSGNLTVNGTTTTVDTVNTTIDDPILLLGSNQTGAGAVDLGILGERGDDTNVFVGYDESADEFVTALVSDADSSTTVTITDYANMHVGGLTADDAITATGNITGGNLITSAAVESATVTATGAVTGGSLTDGTATLSSGALSGATSGSFSTTLTATGNITGGNLITSAAVESATVTATGAVTGGTLNTAGTVTATGNITGGNLITAGTATATGGLNTSGDVNATNVNLTGDVYANNLRAYEGLDVGTFGGGNVTISNVGVLTSTAASSSFSGNVTAGNFVTAGKVDTATLDTSGAATLGGTLDVTGDTTVANFEVNASSTLEFNENTLGNVGTPVATADAATKGYVDNLLSSGFTISDSEDTPNTQTISQGDTLTIAGTANEITAIVSSTDTLTIGLPDDVEVTGDLTVGGNLIVQGSQTIVDATSTSIVDPILQLGRGANNAALTANDGKDRGISMYYYDGSEKVAFFGFDDPSDEFRFIPEATISSEAVTGSLGTANLGKVRVDNIDIDGNTLEATSGNLTIQAAGTDKIVLPTGNELVITDMGDTGVLYSNSGEVSADASNFYYDGTELYALNMYSGGYLNVDGTANVATLEVAGDAAIDGAITSVTNVTASGAITTDTTVTATGNITGGNLVTAGAVDNGTITMSSGNLSSSGSIRMLHNGGMGDGEVVVGPGVITLKSDSGTVNFSTTGLGNVRNHLTIASSGNVTQFQTLEGATFDDYVTVTGNITGGNLITSAAVESATVTATGTITGGTLTDGTMSVNSGAVTGVTSLAVDNITIDGDDITTSGSALTINDAGADVDFRVESDNNANMLFVDAGADQVMIGTATPTTGATFKIGATDSLMIPVGTTAERPTGAGGMIRYNSTTDQYEAYDVSEAQFKALGVPAFTTIASQTFNGDGTTTVFTLSSDQTTQSCIVSINGVVQLPTSAYAVSGNAMTFTEAPESGDTIEVRQITTTSTVASLANGDATVSIETLDSGIEATGNLTVTGSISATGGFSGLDATKIENGTTKVEIASSNGNIEVTGDMIPTIDSDGTTGYSLGSPTAAWKDVYVSSGSLYVNGQKVLQDDSGTIVVSADANQNLSIQTTGSGDVELDPTGTGIIQVKGTLQIEDGVNITNSAGNPVAIVDGVASDSVISKTLNTDLTLSGNGTGIVQVADSLTVTGDLTVNGTTTTVNSTTLTVADKNITIANGAADATAANGAGLTVDGAGATFTYTSSGDKWNMNKGLDLGSNNFVTTGEFQGTATSAQYADLAEKYEADADYEPGTVVHFGGEKEVSMCDMDHCSKVAGVVSTAPAYRMNDGLEAEHVAMVALTGRVPCKVTGPVAKGDMMVSAGNGMARAESDPKVGTVIGKALENHEGGEGVIEVVVGKH